MVRAAALKDICALVESATGSIALNVENSWNRDLRSMSKRTVKYMVYMKFSKERFLQNAESAIKRQIKDHIDVLDGMQVRFPGSYKYGFIKQYFANGQEYHLYPIYKEWCQDEEQRETYTQMHITGFIEMMQKSKERENTNDE